MNLSGYAKYLDIMYDQTVGLFTQSDGASSNIYSDTTDNWTKSGTLAVNCTSVDDAYTIEIYGPRVDKMFMLHCRPDSAVKDGMGVSLDSAASKPDYKVKSVKPWQTHMEILIEVIGVGYQG